MCALPGVELDQGAQVLARRAMRAAHLHGAPTMRDQYHMVLHFLALSDRALNVGALRDVLWIVGPNNIKWTANNIILNGRCSMDDGDER